MSEERLRIHGKDTKKYHFYGHQRPSRTPWKPHRDPGHMQIR